MDPVSTPRSQHDGEHARVEASVNLCGRSNSTWRPNRFASTKTSAKSRASARSNTAVSLRLASSSAGSEENSRTILGLEVGESARWPARSIAGFLHRASRGSFPELAFADRTPRQRRLWLDSYVEDLVSRDVESIGAQRDPVRLRLRTLTALALNLAGQPSDATLFRDAGINAKTADAYDRALASLAVLDVVPAWASSRLSRLTKTGKRYIVDTALAAAAAGVSEHDIVRDNDLRGRWFDAFAVMQLRAELAIASPRMPLHHLRVEGGRHEIDLVVDVGRGRIFGLEFKAGAAPTRSDARHLVWLRDELGKKFAGGIVLHAGQAVVELDAGIAAIPLSAVWTFK
jgi:predicted AAA+ superfamily ATPase